MEQQRYIREFVRPGLIFRPQPAWGGSTMAGPQQRRLRPAGHEIQELLLALRGSHVRIEGKALFEHVSYRGWGESVHGVEQETEPHYGECPADEELCDELAASPSVTARQKTPESKSNDRRRSDREDECPARAEGCEAESESQGSPQPEPWDRGLGAGPGEQGTYRNGHQEEKGG